MPPAKRAELADIISHYGAVDPELVERVRAESTRYGFEWS